MGNCSYVMSKPCNDTSLPYFEVHVDNENRFNKPTISYVKAVHVYVHGVKISILKGGTVQVRYWQMYYHRHFAGDLSDAITDFSVFLYK